jgi:hypothetical protein
MVEIVISWPRKKRMISVLLKRNRDSFNEKSFEHIWKRLAVN